MPRAARLRARFAVVGADLRMFATGAAHFLLKGSVFMASSRHPA
jgi:hypothetical protein